MINKPVYLWPFILVYRIVTFIIKVPILFVRYFCLGFYFVTYFLLAQIITLFSPIFRYGFLGLMFLCYIVYFILKTLYKYLLKGIRYFVIGLAFPFIILYNNMNSETAKAKRKEIRRQRELKRQEEIAIKEQLRIEKEEKIRLEQEKKRIEKEEIQKQEELKRQEEIARKEQLRIEKEEKIRLEQEKKRLEKEEIQKQRELKRQEKQAKKEQLRIEKEEKIRLEQEKKRLEKEEIQKQRELKRQEKQAKKEQLRIEKEEKIRLEQEKKRLEKEEIQKQRELKRQEKEARKEQLRIENQTLSEKAEQGPLVIKQDNVDEVEETTKDEYTIHAPQNEILDDEKNDALKNRNALSKEEKKKLKLERIEAKRMAKEAKLLEKEKLRNLSKEEKQQLKLEKLAAKKEAKMKRAEERRKQQEKLNDIYINENVQIEKMTFGKKLAQILNDINHLPDKISESLQKSWNNSTFVKNRKNRMDMSRQALLINFEGDDAVKSDKKVVYEYVGKNADGKLVKGYFEAFSKVEVHSFLLSEGFEVYSIKTNRLIQLLHGNTQITKTKIKVKDLIFFLTQLSTYIKAGIPLVESLKILSRQYKNKSYQRIFRAIIYDLTMGEAFSEALAKQGNAFPKLLINMIKASEMTGELPEALDDMAEYYTETDKTRKQMITAMMYPSIIFIISVAAVTFIMVFVVPKFVTIYESMDNARLPWITQFVIDVSTFMETRMALIIFVTGLIIAVMVYIYKHVKTIRTLFQYLVMHIPVFGNVIIYNEVTMFTKTFCSLLRHNVFITDSMEILNKITNNEIYKMIILDTITNLARGEKISLAFKDHWAVPIPAYEMIVTGERTGQLPEMMGKVSAYYQEMHKNAVARIKTFIEPALILFLTVVVGGIVLSIIVPMFDMYNNMGL